MNFSFEEVVFAVPEVDPLQSVRAPGSLRDHLKVAVHFGAREEMMSMTTLDITDLEGLVCRTEY